MKTLRKDMKELGFLLTMLVLVLLTTSCDKKSVPIEDDNFPKTIEYATVGQCILYGEGEEGFVKENFVIASQSEWDELKVKIGKPSCTMDDFLTKEIDFAYNQIIAVFEEVKENGGWSVDITDVTEYVDKIVVTVTNVHTGDDTHSICQPFHIVTIPVSDKDIVFEYIERDDGFPKELEFTTIGQCVLYGIGEEHFAKEDVVITSQFEWEKLKVKINKPSFCSTDDFQTMEVDFNQYQIIAVFEDVKWNGGWSIDITGVTEYADKIIATVTNLNTGNSADVITRPFHIITIPASDKEIVFEKITPVIDITRLISAICWPGFEQDVVHLINSQQEYEKHVSGNDIPEIDFEKYSLVIVWGKVNGGIRNVEKELIQITANAQYDLNVIVELNNAEEMGLWKIAFLVDKLPDDTIITLSTKVVNPN